MTISNTQKTTRRSKEDRRKQILDAALAVFYRKGYGEATIPDIAREAGVGVGTIYNYYVSKREILVSLVQVYTYVMAGPLRELLAQLAKEDEKTFVRAIMEAGLDWASDDLNGFIFVFSEVLRDRDLGAPFAGQLLTSLLQSMEKYVAERSSSGHFRHLDQKLAARALGGMIVGFLVLRQLEGEHGPTNAKAMPELTAELADIFLEGVRNRSTGHAE